MPRGAYYAAPGFWCRGGRPYGPYGGGWRHMGPWARRWCRWAPMTHAPSFSAEEEAGFLREQADSIRAEIERIEARLKEIEGRHEP